jgi:hypothetical protein
MEAAGEAHAHLANINISTQVALDAMFAVDTSAKGAV